MDIYHFLFHSSKITCRLGAGLQTLGKGINIVSYYQLLSLTADTNNITDLPETPSSFGQFVDHSDWDHRKRRHGEEPANPVSPPRIHVGVVELQWCVTYQQKHKGSL